jgi:hypothetical protein
MAGKMSMSAASSAKEIVMTNVIVVIGPDQLVRQHGGLAQISTSCWVTWEGHSDAAAKVLILSDAGFEVSTAPVDVSSRESVCALVQTAAALGDISGVIHAARVSPSQAPPATILAVDLYGTALVLEELGNVIARGGAGLVISSMSGYRLPPPLVRAIGL